MLELNEKIRGIKMKIRVIIATALMIAGAVCAILGVERLYITSWLFAGLYLTLVPVCRIAAYSFFIAACIVSWGASKFLKTSMLAMIGALISRIVWFVLLFFDVNTVVIGIFYAIETAAFFFGLYNAVDGIASYHDRIGNRRIFNLAVNLRPVIVYGIALAYGISWVSTINVIYENETLYNVISLAAGIVEACSLIVFIYYLIKSFKTDY